MKIKIVSKMNTWKGEKEIKKIPDCLGSDFVNLIRISSVVHEKESEIFVSCKQLMGEDWITNLTWIWCAQLKSESSAFFQTNVFLYADLIRGLKNYLRYSKKFFKKIYQTTNPTSNNFIEIKS